MLKKIIFILPALALLAGMLWMAPGFRNKVKEIYRQGKYSYNERFANQTSWLLHTKTGGPGQLITARLISPALYIDRIYKSMEGPFEMHTFKLNGAGSDSLIWLKSYRVDILDKTGTEPRPAAFMCHNNLNYNVGDFLRRMGLSDRIPFFNSRLITLTGGQTDFELPDGFGLPMLSEQLFTIQSQVLNHNLPDAKEYVRQQTTISYFRNSDAQQLKPLFSQNIYVGFAATTDLKNVCSKGECIPAPASNEYMIRKDGKNYTGHWVIKPGRDTFRTEVTQSLHLPFSTTIHAIGVHTHPFAESLSIKDLTTDSIIYTSKTKNATTGIGLEKIDYYTSVSGIPVYRDHRYELICESNNTSGSNQDMMAVMLLYMYDKELDLKLHPR
jgi:hypothetical protein